jgi:hypothetical protein
MVEVYSSVVATKKQISSELVGGAVILDHRKSGVYCARNSVGASIWNLLHQPKTVNEIPDTLLTEYFVESSQCDRMVLPLLQALKSDG